MVRRWEMASSKGRQTGKANLIKAYLVGERRVGHVLL